MVITALAVLPDENATKYWLTYEITRQMARP